jgi:hypothetical protein
LRASISLKGEKKHLHDHIIALRRGNLAYKPSLTLPRFQVPVPTKKVSGHVFSARGINFAYMILIFEFEIALIVWYLFFILYLAGLKL